MGLVPKLNKCCCVCSLRTGTLILLWLGMIYAILRTIQLFKYELRFSGNEIFYTETIIVYTVCILGLIAVHTENPGLLIPYLIYQVIFTVFLILCVLVIVLAGLLKNHELQKTLIGYSGRNYSTAVTPVILNLLINIGLYYYFSSVVYNYCYKLKESKSKRAPQAVYFQSA